MRFVLSALISSGVLALFHIVTYRRIIRPFVKTRRGWVIAVFAALGVTIPGTIVLLRTGHPIGHGLAWLAFPWLALVGLGTMYVIIFEPLRLWWTRRGPDDALPNADRREAIVRMVGGAALVATTGHTGYGATQALGEHVIERVPVTIARWPQGLRGFRIVQITDLHIGTTVGRAYIQDVVDRTNALSPDLIVLTGDLVDGAPNDLAEAAAPLAQLRAKHGVFAVTGNHEYYSGADRWITHFRQLGVRFLRNEHVTIGEHADAFDLAGIDDRSGWMAPGHGADIDAAVRGRDPSRALILLAHQPRQVRDVQGRGVDLQLSGHTHGGQIYPWHYLVWLQQRGLVAGMYTVGDTRVYVSRGAAYWGPPVRVGAPLEITEVTLSPA